MNTEVREIFELIEKSAETKAKALDFFAETLIEKILAVVSLVSLLLGVVMIQFETTQNFAIISGVVFLFASVIYSLINGRKNTAGFVNPLSGFAEIWEERLKAREEYIELLSKFSTEKLKIAANTIESHIARIEKTLGIVMGAVNKAGVIPAGVALYYTGSKIVSDSDDYIARIVMMFVVGLYFGAILGYRITGVLERNLECLKAAIALREQRLIIVNC